MAAAKWHNEWFQDMKDYGYGLTWASKDALLAHGPLKDERLENYPEDWQIAYRATQSRAVPADWQAALGNTKEMWRKVYEAVTRPTLHLVPKREREPGEEG